MVMKFVFISCGQYTDAEKDLGKGISELVKKTTNLGAFFAEDVQDLNGLDSNILNALRDCAALIAVMHPRGEVERPDGSKHVRASVWIEQEIAIATYIRRVEKRSLPVIAFVHRSVGHEGIRDLLHLNPIPFTEDSEVLAALPGRLESWKMLSAGGLRVELGSTVVPPQDGHPIRRLHVLLVNDTNQSITNFNCKVCLPKGLLSHWNQVYTDEVKSEDARYRCFRFDEEGRGHTPPHDRRLLAFFDYCTRCASEAGSGEAASLPQAAIDAKVWIDGREYSDRKTIEELAREREGRAE